MGGQCLSIVLKPMGLMSPSWGDTDENPVTISVHLTLLRFPRVSRLLILQLIESSATIRLVNLRDRLSTPHRVSPGLEFCMISTPTPSRCLEIAGNPCTSVDSRHRTSCTSTR